MHWPDRITGAGGLRTPFAHVIESQDELELHTAEHHGQAAHGLSA
jgi:hypothetical protein